MDIQFDSHWWQEMRRQVADVKLPIEPPAPAAAKPPLRGALVLGAGKPQGLGLQLQRALLEAKSGVLPPGAPPSNRVLQSECRLAIDFDDGPDLLRKGERALKALEAAEAGNPQVWRMLRASGVHFGTGAPPKVAFLFTGQGSQYVNMLRDLVAREPVVADAVTAANRLSKHMLDRPLLNYLYPFGLEGEVDPNSLGPHELAFMRIDVNQPAVLAADIGLYRLLATYGIRPDMMMGHSWGEYPALCAGGALSFVDAYVIGYAMIRFEHALTESGAMAVVFAPVADVQRVVDSTPGYVTIANYNSGSQVVIGGAADAVQVAAGKLIEQGHTAFPIPVSHAFHTNIVAPVCAGLASLLDGFGFEPPSIPTISNMTGDFYPTDAKEARSLLVAQMRSPVQFMRGLQTLHQAGARLFVEVGPKKALHGFAEDVLGNDPTVVTVFTNHPKFGDIPSFNAALCACWAAGIGRGT